MGRLFHCIVKGTDREGQSIEGTDNFFIFNYENIPRNRCKKITYTYVVCTVRPPKEDPNRTRITINGNCICYPGDVGTPTASLDIFKLVVNSVLSRRG